MSEQTPEQGSFDIKDGAFVPIAPESRPRAIMRQEISAEELAKAASASGRENDPNARRAEQLRGVGGGLAAAVSGELVSTHVEDDAPLPRPLPSRGRGPGPSAGYEAAHQLEADTRELLDMRARGGDPEAVSRIEDMRQQLADTQPTKAVPVDDAPVITSSRLEVQRAREALAATRPDEDDGDFDPDRPALDFVPRDISDKRVGKTYQPHDGRAPYPYNPPMTTSDEPHPETGPDNVRLSQWRARTSIKRAQNNTSR